MMVSMASTAPATTVTPQAEAARSMLSRGCETTLLVSGGLWPPFKEGEAWTCVARGTDVLRAWYTPAVQHSQRTWLCRDFPCSHTWSLDVDNQWLPW